VGPTGVAERGEAMSAAGNQREFFLFTVKKRKKMREIGEGFAQAFLVFSLLLDNPKEFIYGVINAWGLVVGTQFTKSKGPLMSGDIKKRRS
jgi:hypothetical protein